MGRRQRINRLTGEKIVSSEAIDDRKIVSYLSELNDVDKATVWKLYNKAKKQLSTDVSGGITGAIKLTQQFISLSTKPMFNLNQN